MIIMFVVILVSISASAGAAYFMTKEDTALAPSPPADKAYECVFDAAKYEAMYPDLQSAFSGDATKLKEHYEKYGKAEGRSPCGNKWRLISTPLGS